MASIFSKIHRREIPAQILYEDDICMAIWDINPVAPTHALVFPIQEIATMDEATTEDKNILGHCLLKASEVAQRLNLSNGYRLVINTKAHGGQTVNHIHIHILGGRQMEWPPG